MPFGVAVVVHDVPTIAAGLYGEAVFVEETYRESRLLIVQSVVGLTEDEGIAKHHEVIVVGVDMDFVEDAFAAVGIPVA